ncbi:sensor histidine kinase [Oribacterium sinus]|uniref:histidine kinase n=1 Tax=Oribacterium sinus F0268 TaxID=585501 RepID=C2L0C3_9FIRM|nr:ATP-binding protein [Oribacterium sinus]EEJ50542.1 histidine kinase A domain protein [Oribacterium sinus F0268]
MRGNRERKIQLIALVFLLTIFLLFADLLIFGIFVSRNGMPYYPDSEEIMEHLHKEKGEYRLAEEESKKLSGAQQFAMLLDNGGNILWSEFLPKELRKSYTLQDVAKFTRYYLEDYPVRTYVVPEGLLIIGQKKEQIWKYTLEYKEGVIRNLIEFLPLFLLFNALILVSVPIWIQKKRAKQKEEERTEWIAGVSHDIRTPLAIVLGNAEMIAATTESEEIKDRALRIEKQGLRLRRLVENLNLFSKLSFGYGNLEKEKIQVSRFLRKTITEMRNQTEDERVQFTLDIQEDLQGLVLGFNENLMERALMNLLYNAVQHNPEGCEITVKLYQDEKAHVFLQVEDNGCGLEKAALKRLNKKNYEWEPSTGQHGLGLKIVKQVISRHRWKVQFREGSQGGFLCRIQMG